MFPHDVPPKPASEHRPRAPKEWVWTLIVIVLLVLLAIWFDLPGWLYDLVAERPSASTNC
jgi:hypothetical protein